MVKAPVFVALSPGGAATARKLREALGEGEIHGASGRVDGVDAQFDDTMTHLAGLFADGFPIVGLCAAGILVRAVASQLADKRDEPPVVAVAEDGSAVVPLIGGHRGANDLARRIAAALRVAPAITTAGDARFGLALNEPPEGWVLANPQDAKPVMAALIGGETARLDGDAPWLVESRLPFSNDGKIALTATDRRRTGSSRNLVYHPKILALGVGCERGCEGREMIALAESVLAGNDLAEGAVGLVASFEIKADEPAIHALAGHFGVPARFFGKKALAAETPRLFNPSDMVLREVGVAGVAEGAALAAAGPGGMLIVEKTKSKRATCAIARAAAPLDPAKVGHARGRLSIVGIGPGGAGWISPEAARLLRAADDWVGYGAYLDLASGLAAGKRLHRFALGEEEARAHLALELAGEGREVALVSSGDPGIYAMATLVYEMLDPATKHGIGDAARRAEIVVAPGISAFQAAAARAGAPLGHDFCAISLSDLLTPWEVIEGRIHAAAEGDFAIAFYNPRSRRRKDQLDRAMAILKQHRPPQTPVVVAGYLGREKEHVTVRALQRFDSADVDMTTLVLVGASTTRAFARGDGSAAVYTPRGYARKREATS
jgi:cobalt-precorrin 5A hydrolase / cobalt-factor III methyltransferase / precorrin-3B C17-methyltransferase